MYIEPPFYLLEMLRLNPIACNHIRIARPQFDNFIPNPTPIFITTQTTTDKAMTIDSVNTAVAADVPTTGVSVFKSNTHFYHPIMLPCTAADCSPRTVTRSTIVCLVLSLCFSSLFALGISSVLLASSDSQVISRVHSSPFLLSSLTPIFKFAEARAVCSSATYIISTYTIGAADTYTWTSCRFDVFGVIDAASMTATSGTTAITVSGGTVAASTAKGIRIIAPTAAIAAARGPLAITVSSVTFESNTILRFDGTLPNSSTVSITGNKFTLTALNTMSTYTNVIYAICMGGSTKYDTYVLQDSASISIKSNTITASIGSAGADIFATAVFFRGSPVTITGSASLSITNNTASLVGSYDGYLVFMEFVDTFTITSSGALTISSNTLQSYTATQTALLVRLWSSDDAVFTNNGRFTVSSNTMENVHAGSRVGFLEFRTDNTLQLASSGGMVLDSNTLTGSNNPGGSTVLYFIITAFGYMKTNSVFYVRSNKVSQVTSVSAIYFLIFRAANATAPYEISDGSVMLIDGNRINFTKSTTLYLNSFEVNSFIMSSLTSWVNITNNAVTSCTATSGDLSIFRSIDTTNNFTVTGFVFVGNSIVTTTAANWTFLLRLHAAGMSLVSGGAMVIESNTIDRLDPGSGFFIAYIPAASAAFSFELASGSLFSFSNNAYKGIRYTSTLRMLYLTSASFTATGARMIMNGNSITNTTASSITALYFAGAVNGAPFTLTSSTFEASWNTASSVTANGTFVFYYSPFDTLGLTNSTYTTDGNTFTSVTASGLQVTRLYPTSLLMTSSSTLSASSNVITGSTSTDAFYAAFLYCAESLRLESKSAITMNDNQFASMTSTRVGIVAYIYVPATAGIVMVGASTLTMENNRATASPSATGTLRAASIVANVLSMTSSTINVKSNRVVSPGTGGAKSAAQMTFTGGITLSGSQLTASSNYIDSASPTEAQVVMFETDGTLSLTASSTVTLSNNYASNVSLSSTIGHVVSVYCGLLTMQTASNHIVAGNSLKSTAITGSSPRWFVVRFRGVSGASTMSASSIAIDSNAFASVTRAGSSQASLVHFSVVSLSMTSASTIAMTNGNVPQMSVTSPLATLVTTTASSNGLQLSGGSSITIATNTLYAAVDATLAALIQLDVDPLIAGNSYIRVVSNTLDATATTTSYSYSGIEFTRAVSLTASGAALNANSNTIRLASASSCPPYAIETSTVTQTASTGGTLSVSGNTVTLTSIGTASTIAASACPAFYLVDVASVSTSSFASNEFSANTAARIHLLKQTVPVGGVATYSSNTVTQTGASGLKLPTVASVVAIVTLVINGNGAMTLDSNTVTAPSAKYVTTPHYVLDNTAFTFSSSASVTACGNRFYNMLRERPAHLYTPRVAMRAGYEVKLCPAFQGRTQSVTLTLSVSATESSLRISATQTLVPSETHTGPGTVTDTTPPSSSWTRTVSHSNPATGSPESTVSHSASQTLHNPRVPSPLRETELSVRQGTNVVISLGIPLATALGSVGGQVAVSNALVRMANCADAEDELDDEDEEGLPIIVHPLQFSFSEALGGQLTAAVVSNCVIIPVGFAMVVWLLVFVADRLVVPGGVDWASTMDDIGWPSLMVVPFATLAEGIGTVSVKAILALTPAGIGFGAMGIGIVFAFGCVWAHVLIVLVPLRLLRWEEDPQPPLRQGATRVEALLHRVSWLNHPWYRWGPRVPPVGGGPPADSPTLNALMLQEEAAVEPDEELNVLPAAASHRPKTDDRSCLHEDVVSRYENFFGPKRWFWSDFVAFSASVAVGFVEGIPSHYCRQRAIIALAVTIPQCVTGVLTVVPLELALQVPISVLVGGMACVHVALVFLEGQADALDDTMLILSIISNIIAVLLSLITFFLSLLNRLRAVSWHVGEKKKQMKTANQHFEIDGARLQDILDDDLLFQALDNAEEMIDLGNLGNDPAAIVLVTDPDGDLLGDDAGSVRHRSATRTTTARGPPTASAAGIGARTTAGGRRSSLTVTLNSLHDDDPAAIALVTDPDVDLLSVRHRSATRTTTARGPPTASAAGIGARRTAGGRRSSLTVTLNSLHDDDPAAIVLVRPQVVTDPHVDLVDDDDLPYASIMSPPKAIDRGSGRRMIDMIAEDDMDLVLADAPLPAPP